MIVAQYFVEFMFYSFLGWIWESIYCLAKERKWADRGFLFGPICPIYGSCAVGTSIVFNVFGLFSSPDFPLWGIFLICFFASVVAEYSTSWVLEKRFHARWWDYSTMPLNIRGRICVPVSIAFGLAGIMIVKYLIPAVEGMRGVINPLLYEITLTLVPVPFRPVPLPPPDFPVLLQLYPPCFFSGLFSFQMLLFLFACPEYLLCMKDCTCDLFFIIFTALASLI